MKKLITTIFIAMALLSATACGNSKNIEYTSEEYLPESDDQTNIIYRRNFAEGKTGYYILDPMGYVQYYDFASKKTHILCNC